MRFDGWKYPEIMAYIFSNEKGKQEIIELVKERLKNEKDKEQEVA